MPAAETLLAPLAPSMPPTAVEAGIACVDVFVSLAEAHRDWTELEAIDCASRPFPAARIRTSISASSAPAAGGVQARSARSCGPRRARRRLAWIASPSSTSRDRGRASGIRSPRSAVGQARVSPTSRSFPSRSRPGVTRTLRKRSKRSSGNWPRSSSRWAPSRMSPRVTKRGGAHSRHLPRSEARASAIGRAGQSI